MFPVPLSSVQSSAIQPHPFVPDAIVAPAPSPAPGVATARFEVQRDFLDHLSNDTIDSLDAVLAANCVLLFPGIRPVEGAALVKRVLRGVRRRYVELTFKAILELRSPDDMLVVNSIVRGIRNDGLPYANDVISLIRLDAAGRVALISDYFKDTTFLEQGSRRVQTAHV